MPKEKMHVVIVGGGFAGLKLIRALRFQPHIHVTLISDGDQFRYSPAMYRTATGYRHKESYLSLTWLLQGIKNTTFAEGKATKIDRQKRIITLEGGRDIAYDYAVIAVGMVTSYFGIPGLEEYSYGIKSVEELNKFHAHLHKELTDEHQLDKNYVIVGAGPTGVELAASLRAYLTRIANKHQVAHSKINIELIEAADRVLPIFPAKVSLVVARRLRRLGVKVMTNKKVQGETHDSLMVDDRPLPSHTVVWTAGVTNNPFFAANADQFTLDDHKKVVVDDYLRVDPHTFVIGDNAATPYSGLAQTAIHNAVFVAGYLKQAQAGRGAVPYRPHRPVKAVPVGPWWAVVQRGNLVLSGVAGSLIRLFADLIGYADIMGWRRALGLWSRRNVHEESCQICRAPQNSS